MTMSDLAGMTVNERLCTLGLIEKWDEAAFSRDREAMLAIMRECEVDPPEQTVDAVLAKPAIYGYALPGEADWRVLLSQLIDFVELGPAVPLLNQWAAEALLAELKVNKVDWTLLRDELLSQLADTRVDPGDHARIVMAFQRRFRPHLP